MTALPGVIQAGPGTDPIHIRLRSADSSGTVGVVELELAAGTAGPPLHVHPTHSEGFYVLAGQLSFQLGEEIVSGGPGTWVFAPANVPHTLANVSRASGRVLCVFAPGGFERRFERMLARLEGRDVPAELAELSPAERATRAIGPPLRAAGGR